MLDYRAACGAPFNPLYFYIFSFLKTFKYAFVNFEQSKNNSVFCFTFIVSAIYVSQLIQQ